MDVLRCITGLDVRAVTFAFASLASSLPLPRQSSTLSVQCRAKEAQIFCLKLETGPMVWVFWGHGYLRTRQITQNKEDISLEGGKGLCWASALADRIL